MKFFKSCQFLVMALCCLPFLSFSQTTYTIGGDAPDFATFQEATDFLNGTTLTETVIFNVRDGIYDEYVVINEVAGASEENRVIFRGENLAQNAVQLGALTENRDAVTLKINDAKYINFSHLNIYPSSNLSTRPVIWLTQLVDDFVLDNVAVIGGVTNAVDRSILLSIESSSNTIAQIKIQNCNFSEGLTAIEARGNEHNNANLIIENNTFSTVEMLHCFNYGMVKLKGNFLQNASSFSYNSPIFIGECKNEIQITENQLLYSGRSLFEIYCSSSEIESVLIANNFIVSDDQVAFHMEELNNLNFNYNTIIEEGGFSASPVFNLQNSSGSLLNNLVYKKELGKFISLHQVSSEDMIIDYNNFYTEGGGWGDSNGGSDQNLADWQASTGFDIHSLQIKPYFIGENTYRLFQPSLDGVGIPVSGITTDIDGNSRDLQASDIGAFTFTAPSVDAGLTTIQLPERPFATGNHTIEVSLRNFGFSTLTAATIEYSVNGGAVQTKMWTGSLTSEMEELVELENVNLIGGVANDIVIEIKSANGTTDEQAYNNIISIESVFTALSGDYLIGGGSNAVFSSLQDAIHVLKESGTAANVFFNIQAGVYHGTYVISDHPRIDPTAVVTIQSADLDAASVQLYASETEQYIPLFNLVFSKNIEFKHLTLFGDGEYVGGFFFVSGGQNIGFQHLSLQYAQINPNSYGIYFGGADKVIIDNCVIVNAFHGINTSTSGVQNNFSIFDNTIDAYGTAITVNNATNIEIRNNSINQEMLPATTPSVYSHFGLVLKSANENVKIAKNKIRSERSGVLNVTYNNLSSDANVQITNNTFEAAGIEHHLKFRGVRISSGKNVLFANNNLITDYKKSDDLALLLENNENISVFNNLILNQGNAPLVHFFNNSGDFLHDNNNWFHTGTIFGIYQYTDAADLSEWQSLSGQAANSLSFEPIFVSGSSYLTYDLNLNDRGVSIGEVVEDIENNLRDPETPDIGAFEFTPPMNDAGIVAIQPPTVPFSPGSYSITTRLKNFGTANLTSADIYYTLNGVETLVNWTGNLAANDETNIVLPVQNFIDIIKYTISVRTTNPNGNPDEQDYNDEYILTDIYTALGGSYSVGTESSDFATLPLAVEVLQAGGVYDNVFFEIAAGNYNESLDIGIIPGAAAERLTTFRSATGNKEDVQIKEGGEDYFLNLHSTSYVTFCDLSYWANHPTKDFILIKGNAEYLSFADSKFETNILGTFVHFEVENGEVQRHNTIQGNEFIGNRSAVNFYNSGLGDSFNNYVLDNRFKEQKAYGVSLYRQGNITLSNNSFINCLFALLAIQISGSIVNANQIYAGDKSSIGLSFSGYLQSETIPNLITNNFIIGTGNRLCAGIELDDVENYEILHNTINMDIINPFQTNTAIYLRNSTSQITIKNNILIANSIYFINRFCIECEINNNACFTKDNNPFSPSFSNGYETLADWQSATNYDIDSRWINPDFTTQPPYKVSNQLVRTVTDDAISTSINLDLEGNSRPSENSLAGAHESGPLFLDLAAVEIPQLNNGIAPGSQSLSLIVANVGSTTVNNFTIEWMVNGIAMENVEWTQGVTAFSEIEVDLGSFDFEVGIDYEVTAQVVVTDLEDEYLPNNLSLYQDVLVRLLGVYTVGGDDPDFNTIQLALETLQGVGVAGDVEFLVAAGDYSLDILLNNFYNANESRVKLVGATGDFDDVIITANNISSSKNGFCLQNVCHWEMTNVTLNNSNSQRSILIIDGKMESISINNCNLRTVDKFNTTLLSINRNADVKKLCIKKSIFENGRNAISKDSQADDFMEVLIEHNKFMNQRFYAINADGFHNAIIQQNQFIKNDNANSNAYTGLTVTSSYNVSVLKNLFYIEESYASAMNLNTNANLSNSSGESLKVINNFVYVSGVGAVGVRAGYWFVGGFEFLNNTISGLMENCVYFYYDNLDTEVISGNIFYNEGNGYAYYRQGDSKTSSIIDYNNYFSDGDYLIYDEDSQFITLAEWQNSKNNKNQNSISINPNFLPVDSYYSRNQNLRGIVPFDNNIPTDIEDNQRPTDFTSIGCYEISAAPPLAIDTLGFVVQLIENQQVKLNWLIENNNDLKAFIIQRSADGNNFENIGKVIANNQYNYQFIDANPLSGNNFYRLQSITNAGLENYSAIQTIYLYQRESIQIFPNPVTDQLQMIWGNNDFSPTKITLIDALGKIIATYYVEEGETKKELNVSNLTSGIYFLKIQSTHGEEKRKFLKL